MISAWRSRGLDIRRGVALDELLNVADGAAGAEVFGDRYREYQRNVPMLIPNSMAGWNDPTDNPA